MSKSRKQSSSAREVSCIQEVWGGENTLEEKCQTFGTYITRAQSENLEYNLCFADELIRVDITKLPSIGNSLIFHGVPKIHRFHCYDKEEARNCGDNICVLVNALINQSNSEENSIIFMEPANHITNFMGELREVLANHPNITQFQAVFTPSNADTLYEFRSECDQDHTLKAAIRSHKPSEEGEKLIGKISIKTISSAAKPPTPKFPIPTLVDNDDTQLALRTDAFTQTSFSDFEPADMVPQMGKAPFLCTIL